ncbi:hypothetical protein MACH17_00180 [Phaeobacter inhibens]|nr:type IV secretory system conjugative DNA transfer family protein [Phaeobacter inhibens]GLO68501.1 hypothetical protein MACH17_00180 [Phaeobacter inhibens]
MAREMRMHKDKQLVFIENMPPLIAQKAPWFEEEGLKDRGVNLNAIDDGEAEEAVTEAI